MNNTTTEKLSERSANIIENLASHIAEQTGGYVLPQQLLPFLPLSLDVFTSVLDEMSEDSAVKKVLNENIIFYSFPAYGAGEGPNTPEVPAALAENQLRKIARTVLHPGDMEYLRAEVMRLAQVNAWPARAVYEHEILYIASSMKSPLRAEILAGRSRYTLRKMRQKLEVLRNANAVRETMDTASGGAQYDFPPLVYPQDLYKKNMAVIESHPASVMEEVETKVVRIISTLGAMLLFMLLLAFLHVPFLLLIFGFLIAGPLASFFIWKHKKRPNE